MFILSILLILSESLPFGASAKDEPQMNADERRFVVWANWRFIALRISGASTKSEANVEHGLRGFTRMGKSVKIRLICVIRVRFRGELFIQRGAGSLPAGLRQWRRAEGRGLGIGERGAQSKFISKYHQDSFEYLFFFADRRAL